MARAIKRIKAGYIRVDVIGTVPEPSSGRRRASPCRPTCAAQQFYNDKCSWKELELTLGANFGRNDHVCVFTCDDRHLPRNREEAREYWRKFIRKLRAVRRKRGEELRYVYVIEGFHGRERDERFGEDGNLEDRRLHYHAAINRVGPDDLEEIQSLWESVGGGYVRLEPLDVHYYRELAKYLTKEAREFGRPKPGERVWQGSTNLEDYEVEYIEIPFDGVTLSPPPGAVDYVQFTERNPYGFADCIGARYLLFEEDSPPEYSYTRGRKRE